jgi:hypothetical protein
MFTVLASTNEGMLDGVVLRLFASGDIFFFWYYFDLSSTLSSFHPTEFLTYLGAPFLGMLGVIPQEFPIGAVIMNEAVGYPLSSFGPNAQLPVLLHMYFADYSYLIGGLFGLAFLYIRRNSYRLIGNFGAGGFYFFVTLYLGAIALFIDVGYFISVMSAAIVIFLLVFFVSQPFVFFARANRRRLPAT